VEDEVRSPPGALHVNQQSHAVDADAIGNDHRLPDGKERGLRAR
jgi:hypothetical protein